MPVEMIVDQWNPRVRKYRFAPFCYGPKSCPLYRAGAAWALRRRSWGCISHGLWTDRGVDAASTPQDAAEAQARIAAPNPRQRLGHGTSQAQANASRPPGMLGSLRIMARASTRRGTRMSTALEDIKEKAQQLSEMERAELALALIESLDGPPDADVEEAWRIEIERRVGQIERGEVQPIPGDEVLERLRRRLR